MSLSTANKEIRRWQRVPLCFPVFLRGRDRLGKNYLELTTALNVSGGGALVALPPRLKPANILSLEIPVPPMPPAVVAASRRKLQARVVRTVEGEPYRFIGVEFNRPLLSPEIG